MRTTAITPRGYCMGVVHAIHVVKQVVKEHPNTPVYLLGMLVHNAYVTDALHLKGVTIIERDTLKHAIATLPKGIIILSAHGSPAYLAPLIEQAGFHVVDAVCKDVMHNFDLVKAELSAGHDVLFVGKKGHPEAEATVAIDPHHVFLIEHEDDLKLLNLRDPEPFLTNQTTLSMIEVYRLHDAIRQQIPQVRVSNDLCDATQTRQEALFKLPDDVDGVLVVGDIRSNNSKMLAQIANQQGKEALLIATARDIPLEYLRQKHHIAVTAGASTPTYLSKQVIEFVKQFDATIPSTFVAPDVDLSQVL